MNGDRGRPIYAWITETRERPASTWNGTLVPRVPGSWVGQLEYASVEGVERYDPTTNFNTLDEALRWARGRSEVVKVRFRQPYGLQAFSAGACHAIGLPELPDDV